MAQGGKKDEKKDEMRMGTVTLRRNKWHVPRIVGGRGKGEEGS